MNFAHPNVISTIQEVALPEVRSTAQSVTGFFSQVGAAVALLITGYVAVASSLGTGLLVISGTG